MVAGPPMHVVLAFKGTTPGGTSYNSPYGEDFVLETSPLKDWVTQEIAWSSYFK